MIEQLTYLLFIKRLDDLQALEEHKANRLGQAIERVIFPEDNDDKGRSYQDYRWSRFKHLAPADMLTVVAEHVFPFLRTLGGDGSTYATHMRDARFTIPTPGAAASGRSTTSSGPSRRPGASACSSVASLDSTAPRPRKRFAEFLDDKRYTANQIEFVNLLIDELSDSGVIEPRRFYESPFTDLSPQGPDALFESTDVDRLLQVVEDVRRRADAA